MNLEARTVTIKVKMPYRNFIPVIAGAGSNDTQKALQLIRIAEEAGAVIRIGKRYLINFAILDQYMDSISE